jgi:hypothetical protein
VQFIGDEPVERPAKNHPELTLIAAAMIRLKSTETASLSPVSFGGPSIIRVTPHVFRNNTVARAGECPFHRQEHRPSK